MSNPNPSKSRMNFYEHIDELRIRIMRCLVLFFIGFIGLYFVSDLILGILNKPLFDAMPTSQRKLYYTSLFENFLTHLKISGYASLFFLSPYYFYQLWAFIKPGLYEKERKFVLPFVFMATLFFLGGACFAYFVVFPIGFHYFLNYGTSLNVPLLTMDAYYSTCLKLLLLFGIAFELPVLVCLLGFLGIVNSQTLRTHRRTAIILITIMAALFAPPDAVSMLILGIPLIFLYEASIRVVHWLEKRRA